jgi:chemotaxis protein CheD
VTTVAAPSRTPDAPVLARRMMTVATGGIGVASGAQSLQTLGVGSCVAIVLLAPEQSLVALAHCLLPQRTEHSEPAAKYVDTAVAELLAAIRRHGGAPPVVAALIGGATMFPGLPQQLMRDIAGGNIAMARTALRAASIPIRYEDVGGSVGRSVIVDAAQQRVMVRTIRGGERWL